MRLLCLLIVLPLLAACEPSCPNVQLLDSAASDPALVEMLFSVTCEDSPVTTVTAADLTLIENSETVSSSESPWVVHRASAVLDTFTLVLIDVSDVVSVEDDLISLKVETVDFVEAALEQGQQVSVAIFDGDPEIRTLVAFSTDLQELTDGINDITDADRRDPSTNLNGAIILGLSELDQTLGDDTDDELRGVANLVVVTDGTDSAQREDDATAQAAVNDSNHEVFVLGVVDEEAATELELLAKDGLFRTSGYDDIVSSFRDLTDTLIAEVGKYYRLSYCSPLRSPSTWLEMQVNHGDGAHSVSFNYETSGFGPGCSLPAN
jgi:hypothetical protein